MRNKYKGNCLICGKEVKEGEGFFEKNRDKGFNGEKWFVRCESCVGKGHPSPHKRKNEKGK